MGFYVMHAEIDPS